MGVACGCGGVGCSADDGVVVEKGIFWMGWGGEGEWEEWEACRWG